MDAPTQTFFVDDDMKRFARLDGIVTLVDAKHIEQHLDEEKAEGVENEAVEQVAFADRLLLNKTDLVSAEDLDRIEKRLRAINGLVRAPALSPLAASAPPHTGHSHGGGGYRRPSSAARKPTSPSTTC